MKIPTLAGTIDRRILVNYKVEKEVIGRLLPAPFTPLLVQDKAIAGICLIRLKHVRPKGFPKAMGISSENGAHRIAVEWTENGQKKQGVYIPRRDTSSRLNALAGGRVFPGVHHLADFSVHEQDGNYQIGFTSDDQTSLYINAGETTDWSSVSVFEDISCASDFFKGGAIGYSPNTKQTFDGMELKTHTWEVAPLTVSEVRSSYFENEDLFPKGSIAFDNALLMRSIEHEWIGLKPICC